MMENKNLEIRKIDYTFEDKGNIIEGRAIVFESLSNDLGGFKEIIKRGAISQELVENSDVFARTNHSDDYILARSNKGQGSLTLELKDDGLYYSFEAPNTEKGNELVEHIRRGEISQSSFAFMVANEPDAERWIKQDVAPVFTPAYDATTVSLRALDKVTELNKPEIEEKVDETNELQTRNTNNKKQLNTMEFRLLKAINAVANNKTLDETASAVIGAGAEEMRKSGLSYGGQIQLPTSELRSAITITAEGEDVVATDLYDIVEPLRAKNVLVQAGAKFLTGLVGDVPPVSHGEVIEVFNSNLGNLKKLLFYLQSLSFL